MKKKALAVAVATLACMGMARAEGNEAQDFHKEQHMNDASCYIDAWMTGDALIGIYEEGNGTIKCYDKNEKLVRAIPVNVKSAGVNAGLIGQVEYTSRLVIGPISVDPTYAESLTGTVALVGLNGVVPQGGVSAGVGTIGSFYNQLLGVPVTYQSQIDPARCNQLGLNIGAQLKVLSVTQAEKKKSSKKK